MAVEKEKPKKVVKKVTKKKVATKKLTKKKSSKKIAKKKDPSKSKAALALKKNIEKGNLPVKKKSTKKSTKKSAANKGERSLKDTPNKMCRRLLLEMKYPDSVIFSKIKEAFPDSTFQQKYIGCKRWDLWNEGKVSKKIERIPEK